MRVTLLLLLFVPQTGQKITQFDQKGQLLFIGIRFLYYLFLMCMVLGKSNQNSHRPYSNPAIFQLDEVTKFKGSN
ncbi:hypothetical protein BFP77_05740 [Maribacter sp. 4U21]|nr:hypothetical protein BFP77_05740 [Maribacter sp. 4U21]